MSSLLKELQAFTHVVFKNDKLVTDELVRKSGTEVLAEVESKGYAVRKNLTDKQARSVFVNIQASAERKTVDDVAKATGAISSKEVSTAKEEDKVARTAYVDLQVASEKAITEKINAAKALSKVARSIWIIHTPLIATPCVTDGKPSPNLLAEKIMQDENLRELTLSRTHIIRDYLKAGGVLVIGYNAVEREQKCDAQGKEISSGRTKTQIDIYEALRKEYPKQIIDFPMELKDQPYPDDMIGATYLVEDTYGQCFEMTNRGVQANKPRDDAEWGVWMQNRSQQVKEVTQRMSTVFSFLQKAGLGPALDKHAKDQNVNQDDYAPLLSRYMSLQIDPDKGVGCKIQ